jgi:hypothetical protein
MTIILTFTGCLLCTGPSAERFTWLSSFNLQNNSGARLWWLMPAILATWEAEIERIKHGGQPGQIVL